VWIDDWLAEKKTEKIKRGRLVTLRSPETIALLERWAGYLKKRFSKLYRQDIKRPDVLVLFKPWRSPGQRRNCGGGSAAQHRQSFRQYPVLFDSGIRSGTEVIKALALGAAAVGIGRPYAYGLALVKRRAFTATRAKPRPEFVSTYTGAKSGKQINESGHSNPLQR
jgi:hypothetical protein